MARLHRTCSGNTVSLGYHKCCTCTRYVWTCAFSKMKSYKRKRNNRTEQKGRKRGAAYGFALSGTENGPRRPRRIVPVASPPYHHPLPLAGPVAYRPIPALGRHLVPAFLRSLRWRARRGPRTDDDPWRRLWVRVWRRPSPERDTSRSIRSSQPPVAHRTPPTYPLCVTLPPKTADAAHPALSNNARRTPNFDSEVAFSTVPSGFHPTSGELYPSVKKLRIACYDALSR